MNRPTEAEIWKLASEPDIDLEFERVLAMSIDEVRESLVAHGYDLRVLEAEAAMLWSQHRTKKLHGGYLLGGVGVLGTLGVTLSAWLGPAVELAPLAATTHAASPAARAAALDACHDEQWAACLAKIDEARAGDPELDQDPEVLATRERAVAKLAEQRKKR